MNYPFEFRELNLTDKVLDAIGFTEYWSGSGDWGTRTLSFEGIEGRYELIDHDENYDVYDGYCIEREYGAQHFCGMNWRSTLYFLHDLYEEIVTNTNEEFVKAFLLKLKDNKVNMDSHIKSYLDYKEKCSVKDVMLNA